MKELSVADLSDHPWGLYCLGMMYAQGRGGAAKDLARACTLLQIAAESKVTKAVTEGLITIGDELTAAKQYSLAASAYCSARLSAEANDIKILNKKFAALKNIAEKLDLVTRLDVLYYDAVASCDAGGLLKFLQQNPDPQWQARCLDLLTQHTKSHLFRFFQNGKEILKQCVIAKDAAYMPLFKRHYIRAFLNSLNSDATNDALAILIKLPVDSLDAWEAENLGVFVFSNLGLIADYFYRQASIFGCGSLIDYRKKLLILALNFLVQASKGVVLKTRDEEKNEKQKAVVQRTKEAAREAALLLQEIYASISKSRYVCKDDIILPQETTGENVLEKLLQMEYPEGRNPTVIIQAMIVNYLQRLQSEPSINFIEDAKSPIPTDEKEAVAYFQAEAKKGNSFALYNLGVAYWFGKGVERNETGAIGLWLQAAERKYAEAVDVLLQLESKWKKDRPVLAAWVLRKLALAGNKVNKLLIELKDLRLKAHSIPRMDRLEILYHCTLVDGNNKQLFKLLRDNSSRDLHLLLARWIIQDINSDLKNVAESAQKLLKTVIDNKFAAAEFLKNYIAAALNNPNASGAVVCQARGSCYLLALGVQQNNEEAYKYLQRAVEHYKKGAEFKNKLAISELGKIGHLFLEEKQYASAANALRSAKIYGNTAPEVLNDLAILREISPHLSLSERLELLYENTMAGEDSAALVTFCKDHTEQDCQARFITLPRLSQVLGSAMKQSGHVIIVTCQKLPYSF